ncbi:MAG TPA: BTAD domain-containing putative transcriptional regulator [Actinoplanes sp.]|nr:BTAD domain-containing putative transcriptional regulator [Actinoplanes sp.]
MKFGVLGALEVTDDGVDLRVGGPRHRALLSTLLVHPGEAVATDCLVDALWGERPPRSAPEMLHVRVSELRRALSSGPSRRADVLITRTSGYLLAAQPDDIDAVRFAMLIGAARHASDGADWPAASAGLAEALALWRGPPFPDIADRPFAQAEIARLEDLRLQAVESRLDADLALGRHAAAVPELRSLVIAHPLHERFWYQLMLALHRCGRTSESLNAYQALRERLRDELGTEPAPALSELHTRILRQEPSVIPPGPPPTAPAATSNNLPPTLTSFVGRHAELDEIADLLRHSRLVTLTGVGGVGKSRLAVEAAAAHLDDYPDGVWFIDLAALTDPRLIAATVATVVGATEHPDRSALDQVVAHLDGARTLLIMDNCEHLGDAPAEFVRRLFDAGPHLRLLCTGRERLRITGEMLRPIDGLPITSTTPAHGNADAVELFAHRAAAVRARFKITADVAPAVERICRRLDGLPLAIELAAARVSSFSPAQIAAELSDRLVLLTGSAQVAVPRHRTLRTVIDWSYGLLSPVERRVFDRLAVFVGGFTFDAADQVCRHGEEFDLVAVLGNLVDKSLVTADLVATPEYRYRQLETVRAYAAERLDAGADGETIRRRHAAYFAAMAAEARQGLRSADQLSWLEQLTWEHGNLRTAMRTWLDGKDFETAAEVAGSIYPFWDLRGHYVEGRRWLDLVLADAGLSDRTRVRALMGSATLAVIQGDGEVAMAACTEAADLSRRCGDTVGLAHALQYLALIATYAEELDEAEVLLAESLAAAERPDAGWERSWAYVFLGSLALAQGDTARAVAATRSADRELAAVGDSEAYAWSSAIRAGAYWAGGRHRSANAEAHAAIRAFHRLGGLFGLSLSLLVAGLILGTDGKPLRSVRVLAAAEALRASIGVGIQPFLTRWLSGAIDSATAEAGAPAVRLAWEAGAQLSPDAAVAEALRELKPPI